MIPLGVLASARVAAGGPLVLASDDFDRADSTTVLGAAQIGGTWAVTGTWGILSNRARCYKNDTIATLDVGISAGYVATASWAAPSWPGIAFRFTSTTSTYWIDHEGTRITLYRRLTSLVSLATMTASTGAMTCTVTVTEEGGGTRIRVTNSANGNTIDYTDTLAGRPTGTRVGLRGQNNAASSFDNFTVVTV